MIQTKNIAFECVTRLILDGLEEKIAIRWINGDLTTEDISYQYFEKESNKISNVLLSLGIKPGDVVCEFLPRSPILISSFFGILKLKAISCCLFSTLGEEALFDRLSISMTKVVITKKSLVRKLTNILERLPSLEYVLVVDSDTNETSKILSLRQLLTQVPDTFDYNPYVPSETPAFIQFTSGSTGKPKGALHVHDALKDIQQSFLEIMLISWEDVYWCTADPAWITGLVYGIIAPFAEGIQQIQFAGVFNASAWLEILETKKVTIWYTAPTALRMLMQETSETMSQYNYSSLKRMYSVGEPLNPEIFEWCKRNLQTLVYDTWFQSETGSIMIANRPGIEIRSGSMGKPREGIVVEIQNEAFEPVPVGKQGFLCLQRGWDSMFRAYFHKKDEYDQKFNNSHYITGDLAKMDSDGYIWYISRADDVINSAGHLIGPFEVESALLEIEEITDVAVVGVNDPILYQKVIAFIKMGNGRDWSKELELKCRIHISNKISTVATPTEFVVVDNIPKNQSGKILRRVLRSIYEGKDPGDLSTMEEK